MGLFGKKYDENGYDKDGFDKDGFDEEGFDKDGLDKDGYNKYGFKNGFNKFGINKKTGTLYDENGFNAEGIKENDTIVQDNLVKVQEKSSKGVFYEIGMVRLDSSLMEKLNIHRDDAVEIKGTRTTVAQCLPTYASEDGSRIIQMDRYIRNNAGAPIDSNVVIAKVRTKNADKIVLRALDENPPIDQRYFSDQLKGNYVMNDDFIYVEYFGEFIHYQIVDSNPSGIPLKITEKTNFHLSHDKNGIGTCYDRELHDSKNPLLRGNIQYNCKLYSDAYSSYDEALADNDNNTFALHGKALCMFHLKEYSDSVNLYDRILSHIKEKTTIEKYKKKQFEEEVTWIVSVLIDDMKYNQALDYLNIYCKIELPDESSLMDRGFVLVKLERNREALDCYEQILQKNPSNNIVWKNKGIVLGKLGRDDEADQCYAKAKELEEE